MPDALLPHDYLLDARTLVVLLSSTKLAWPGGTEGSSWVPTATWPFWLLVPLSSSAVHLTQCLHGVHSFEARRCSLSCNNEEAVALRVAGLLAYGRPCCWQQKFWLFKRLVVGSTLTTQIHGVCKRLALMDLPAALGLDSALVACGGIAPP